MLNMLRLAAIEILKQIVFVIFQQLIFVKDQHTCQDPRLHTHLHNNGVYLLSDFS